MKPHNNVLKDIENQDLTRHKSHSTLPAKPSVIQSEPMQGDKRGEDDSSQRLNQLLAEVLNYSDDDDIQLVGETSNLNVFKVS